MRAPLVVLMLVCACLRPSRPSAAGYVVGGGIAAAGGGLIALSLSLVSDCERDRGVLNPCAQNMVMGLTFGSLLVAYGLAKIGVQVFAAQPNPLPPNR